MKIETYNLLPSFGTNTYLVWDEKSNEGIIIDPAQKSKKLLQKIKDREIKIRYILNTHGHGDHIGGNYFFTRALVDVPIAIHTADAEMLINPDKNLSTPMGFNIKSQPAQILLTEDSNLNFGNNIIKILHTPGHTEGGISILINNLLFSGDTLFKESIGRTDLPGGNLETLKNSIKNKIFKLPESTIVLPGHGPKTSIKKEKTDNPFVGLAAKLF